jgi:hypothetical protein
MCRGQFVNVERRASIVRYSGCRYPANSSGGNSPVKLSVSYNYVRSIKQQYSILLNAYIKNREN